MLSIMGVVIVTSKATTDVSLTLRVVLLMLLLLFRFRGIVTSVPILRLVVLFAGLFLTMVLVGR